MKPLWINILILLASMAACQNMTGVFLSDWQNVASGQCAPDFITINETSNNTYVATYNYTYETAALYCTFVQNFTGNYSANLTQATNGTWIDTQGQQLIYDETTDVFYFVPNNDTNYTYGNPLLYDRTGSYFPLELALDSIGGTWNNPTPLNSSSNGCCVPDSLFVTMANQNIIVEVGEITIMPNYSTTNCSKFIDAFALGSIFSPSTNQLNWTEFGSNMKNMSDYMLNPYNASQLLARLDDNNSCWYTYDKVPNQNLISNTWKLDWQTANALYVPTIYSISIVNGSFMEGTLEFASGNSTSYVVGNNQNHYTDSTMQLTFAYSNSTNTLMSISGSTSQVLYSPTGSILPNNLANTYWTNAQATSNGNLDSCCVPNYISITPTNISNSMNVAYLFPSNYTGNSACHSIAAFVNSQNELESTLNVTTPSPILVTWSDTKYTTQMSFVNASTTSEILISDFLGDGCYFQMAVTTTPPAPLSGNWMSVEVKAIMVLCMVVLFGNM